MSADRLIRNAASAYDAADTLADGALRLLERLKAESGKTCAKCGERQPLSAFGRDGRERNGLHRLCRRCRSRPVTAVVEPVAPSSIRRELQPRQAHELSPFSSARVCDRQDPGQMKPCPECGASFAGAGLTCSGRCRQRRSRARRSAARDAALALLERRDSLAAAGGTAEQVAALDDRARALLRTS